MVLETAGPSCHGAGGCRRTEQEGRMQCEEDWLVMHALHAQHGWSISKIAREFGVNWRTARRCATGEAVPRYLPRERPAELTEAQLAHVRRRLGRCADLRATTLYRELRKLHALVEILGYSRMVAVRFATDTTRPTTLRLLVAALDDLGGAPSEVLSDRDPALVIGETPLHRAVFAPEWSDLAATLGTRPRACRPHRAQTKGKVERAIREVKEDFLRWLTGQVLPTAPTLGDYDHLARRWALEVVATRRHRTTGRVVDEAWTEERALLREIPARIISGLSGERVEAPARVIDLSALRETGAVVHGRDLADYEAVLP